MGVDFIKDIYKYRILCPTCREIHEGYIDFTNNLQWQKDYQKFEECLDNMIKSPNQGAIDAYDAELQRIAEAGTKKLVEQMEKQNQLLAEQNEILENTPTPSNTTNVVNSYSIISIMGG